MILVHGQYAIRLDASNSFRISGKHLVVDDSDVYSIGYAHDPGLLVRQIALHLHCDGVFELTNNFQLQRVDASPITDGLISLVESFAPPRSADGSFQQCRSVTQMLAIKMLRAVDCMGID